MSAQVFIKTTRQGWPVVVENGELLVDGKFHARRIDEAPEIQAKYPGITHISGRVGLTASEAEIVRAALTEQQAIRRAREDAEREVKKAALIERLRGEGKVIVSILEELDDGWGEGTSDYLLVDEEGNRGFGDLYRSIYDDGVIAVDPEAWKVKRANMPKFARRKAAIEEEEARKAAKEAEKDAARAKEDARRAELLEKARETGVQQEICRYVTTECRNGNDCECSTDIATMWAMPDGTIRTVYSCTF